MEEFDSIERAGYTAKLFHDHDASSPDDWDTFGKIAYSDSRIGWNTDGLPSDPYGTGIFVVDCSMCDGDGALHDVANGKHAGMCPKCQGDGYVVDGMSACRALHGDVVAVLPIYANDGPYTILHVVDDWEDANGWIFATQETADMTGVPAEKYEEALRQDLETWNTYLSGDVYGIVVEDADGREVDSCWGFYGLDYAREEAASMLDIEPVRLLEKFPGLKDMRVN